MHPLAHTPLRFPLKWLLLACAAVIASWTMTQWPLGARAPRLSAPAVLPGNTLPHITEERAIAIALNDFEVNPGEITLRHSRQQAAFTAQGVTFTPRGGGPEWAWQLSQVRLGAAALEGVVLAGVSSAMDEAGIVRFDRGLMKDTRAARSPRRWL